MVVPILAPKRMMPELNCAVRAQNYADTRSETGWTSIWPDGFGEGRAQDAALGDDGGDVFRRGDVEGGVLDADAVGRDLDAVDVGDLAGGALFDGDEVAGWRLPGRWC